jgi:hypothetical protein
MLEEAIPALWSAVHGFFTPAVLFILLNVVIGTIAVTSKVARPAAAVDGEDAAHAGAVGGADQQQQNPRRLSRVPSMAFERIRSFNLSRFTAPAPEPAAVTGVVDLGYDQLPVPPTVEKEEAAAAAVVEPEPEPEPVHMERCRSEAAAESDVPRLPSRLHKSASEKTAFSHFEAQEVEEAVQAEPEEEAGRAVDADAENFINKFRSQLKLQRMESILRYRENVRRGQAAAAAAAGGV